MNGSVEKVYDLEIPTTCNGLLFNTLNFNKSLCARLANSMFQTFAYIANDTDSTINSSVFVDLSFAYPSSPLKVRYNKLTETNFNPT